MTGVALFYDKCVGIDDHSFNNIITRSILIEDLNDDYDVVIGEEAIHQFNNLIKRDDYEMVNFKIPYLDKKLYEVRFYTKIHILISLF